jgi:hypothetical protein
MKTNNQLIHIHKVLPNVNICTIVYHDYLDETHYLKLIETLFHSYYNKSEILLPFSINNHSNVVIFYNIYKKFNFKKIDYILEIIKDLKFINISYICFESKINSSLKPTQLPSYFDTLGNLNIKILNSYLKESSYKIFNLEENGIIKE